MGRGKVLNRIRLRRTGVLVCLGYALFLASNATIVWGGVFPFLPQEIQTPSMTAAFFIAQASTFALRFILGAALAWARPESARAFHPARDAAPYALGWSCLIAISYAGDAPGADGARTVAGGCLIGLSTAAFFMAWQRVFAAQRPEHANMQLIIANLIAPALYALLYLIPRAVTALLVAFVIMPVFALCCELAGRRVDLDAPMFTQAGRERPQACRLVVKDYWRSALCIGAVAFSCGVIRALAVENAEVASVVNSVSMAALFCGAACLLLLWRTRPVRLNIVVFFHVAFPALTTAFVVLPVFGPAFLNVFAGCLYAVYGCAVILTMIQCAQAARDRDVHPLFVYGLVAGTMYGLHDLGFLFGAYAQRTTLLGLSPLTATSLMAVYVLGIMFFVSQGGIRAAISPNHLQAGRVELVVTSARKPRHRAAAPAMDAGRRTWTVGRGHTALAGRGAPGEMGNARQVRDTSGAGGMGEVGAPDRANGTGDAPGTNPASSGKALYADKISKQCGLLQSHFKLTDRETQIVEEIARGYTVSAVAQHLALSENTVRTHAKRIYTKLDIHKKQQLIELVQAFDPSGMEK